MSDVVKFPKRYTSYRVAYLPFPNSPILHFIMQCPYDRIDEFLEYLFAMPPEEAYYFEVHGMLADGSVEVVRGDITSAAPRGRVSIKHTALISPGTTMADNIRTAAQTYIAEQSESLTANITRRRASLTQRGGIPAAPAKTESTELSTQTDSEGKPRFVWDAQKAQYVEKATGHCISKSQWAEIRQAREAAKTNRAPADTSSPSYIPPATIVATELKKIAQAVEDPLDAFPVVLTTINIEEFK